MVRIRPETALEIKKIYIDLILGKKKENTIAFFQGIETSIAFLGKKQKIFKSIDFK